MPSHRSPLSPFICLYAAWMMFSRALALFVSRSLDALRCRETTTRKKTEVIVEHFHHKVRYKIGGKAKAMVVTCSRLHAVRYKAGVREVHRREGLTTSACW